MVGAIALGAIVAPPDAAAATAICARSELPYRLQDLDEPAQRRALLIYRVAVGAAALSIYGASLRGMRWLAVRGRLSIRRISTPLTQRITDAPSAIIVQFAGTFTEWIVAEHVGLSGILTIVAYAITIARTAPARTPARLRCRPSGVGHRRVRAQRAGVRDDRPTAAPDLSGSTTSAAAHCAVAACVLATVITRIAWVTAYSTALQF